MKNTIYLDSDFNFLLLENEEEDNGLTQTKIYINIPTSAAANQALEISVAGGAPITESIPSSTKVNFELSQQYWADNGDVEITPKNDDVTGDTITIHFPETFTVSAALNYVFDDDFEIVAQNEDFAETGSGGSGSGSGSGGGSAFDFVETIRNIGFRLLDEPSNVNAYFDEVAEEVQIKWTDPADISTNEPAPATWAGTVVVRKEGSAPRHRWDGDLIVDSTTRDQYASNALIDNTLDISKNYYYGIFPYDTKGDYRFTKVVTISSQPIPAPEIVSIVVNGTAITVNYSVADRYTYDYITLVYKKNSAPADKTDGTAVSLSASDTSVTISGFDINSTYYFKIFAQVTGASEELESNTENVVLPAEMYRCVEKITVEGLVYNLTKINDYSIITTAIKQSQAIVTQRIYGPAYSSPSFVSDFGDSLYYEDKTTFNEPKRVIYADVNVEISCPSGIIHDAYEGDINGMRISLPTSSPYIGSAYDFLNQNNIYVNYYMSIILEESYHRGYILIERYVSGSDENSGYTIWIVSGRVNGVDYIYEAFKDM